MTASPEIVELSPGEFVNHREEVVDVYRVAFAEQHYPHPQNEVSRLADVVSQHAQRVGFKCCVVREGPHDPVRGVGYGYTSAPGQWWHDVVAAGLAPADARTWLSDCFEVVELHLSPALQGRGLGGGLHDALLDGLPHKTAALSTLAQETPAQIMYKKRGWIPLLEHFSFPGGTKPFCIMGLDLGARRTSSA